MLRAKVTLRLNLGSKELKFNVYGIFNLELFNYLTFDLNLRIHVHSIRYHSQCIEFKFQYRFIMFSETCFNMFILKILLSALKFGTISSHYLKLSSVLLLKSKYYPYWLSNHAITNNCPTIKKSVRSGLRTKDFLNNPHILLLYSVKCWRWASCTLNLMQCILLQTDGSLNSKTKMLWHLLKLFIPESNVSYEECHK